MSRRTRPPTRITNDTDTWPKPRWAGHMASNTQHYLWWDGDVEIELDDGSIGQVISLRVNADLHGRLIEDSWETTWVLDDDEEVSDLPPWEGFAALWQHFATETWFEEMKQRVAERFEDAYRESRSGRLITYRTRKEAKAALDEIGPLHHAYNQPPDKRGAALRLAENWTGTHQEYVETLPRVLE